MKKTEIKISSDQLLVIVDADAIVAQVAVKDKHHAQAKQIAVKLSEMDARILYPATAIPEAVTFIQRVLGKGVTAYGVAGAFLAYDVNIIQVNHRLLQKALQLFSPTTSKKNTLYDCIVASIADIYKADAIFSFDKFYKKKGFKLASELI